MCGSNQHGQLASKPKSQSDTGKCCVEHPTRAASLETHVIDAITCGATFTVAVTQAGQMIGWGASDHGQVGAPKASTPALPRIIKGLAAARIERVAAGAAHVLALSQHFQIFSFGQGSQGALGHSDLEDRDSPKLVEDLWCAGICAIDAGDFHSIAAAVDGRVWTWGRGKYGRLGHGDSENCLGPKLVGSLSETPIVGVAAGGQHTVLLSQRRRVYTCGQNRAGQLGLGHDDECSVPVVVADSESWRITQARSPAVAHCSLHGRRTWAGIWECP